MAHKLKLSISEASLPQSSLVSECRERTRMAEVVTNFRLNQFIKIIKWIKGLKETHSEQGNTKLVL